MQLNAIDKGIESLTQDLEKKVQINDNENNNSSLIPRQIITAIKQDKQSDKDTTIGIKYLIENFGKSQKNYIHNLTDTDFTRIYDGIFKRQFEFKGRSSDMNKEREIKLIQEHHDVFMCTMQLFLKMDLTIIDIEFYVIDRDLEVPQSPINTIKKIPNGYIDILCYDPSIGKFILCDVKTINNPRHSNYTLEQLVLKQKHAIQLSWYAILLERMAKKAKTPITVDHFLIIGYDSVTHPTDIRTGIWKINRNDEKWLKAKGIEDKWYPTLP